MTQRTIMQHTKFSRFM